MTKLEGDRGGNYATLTREVGREYIDVRLQTPQGTEEHRAPCEDREGMFAVAVYVQEAMDGVRGTGSMIHDYFREIERLAW